MEQVINIHFDLTQPYNAEYNMYPIAPKYLNEPHQSFCFNETLLVQTTDFCHNMMPTQPYENRNSANLIIRDDFEEKQHAIVNQAHVEPDRNEDDEAIDSFDVERMQTITVKKDFHKTDYMDPNYARPKSIHQFFEIDSNRGFGSNGIEKSSNLWNYDEINDLKMRFLSLLSRDDSSVNKYEDLMAINNHKVFFLFIFELITIFNLLIFYNSQIDYHQTSIACSINKNFSAAKMKDSKKSPAKKNAK